VFLLTLITYTNTKGRGEFYNGKVEDIERTSVMEQTKKKSIVREYVEAIIIALILHSL